MGAGIKAVVKYWGYLLAKLVVGAAVLYGVARAIGAVYDPLYLFRKDPFGHDLGYTTLMMGFSLLCAGVLFLIIRDQRYRCRTCLRKLRMPVGVGSWPNSLLIGRPSLEYICIYGHGTLKVPEEQITGSGSPDWQPHGDDIWKELETLSSGR